MIKFECLKNEQLLERYKLVKIKIVKGSCDNIKITTEEDLR